MKAVYILSNIRNQQLIKVCNYTPNKIYLNTRNGREINFSPCVDGVPSIEFMSFDDIEWMNGRGEIFKVGTLRFDPELESEIFEALGLPNWRDSLFSEERIEELILDPTPDNMRTIIAITNSNLIERIRGKMYLFKGAGKNVSSRLEDVVERRTKEICNGKVKSAMIVRERQASAVDNAEEVNALKEELARVKEMIEQQNSVKSQAEAVTPKAEAAQSKSKPKSTTKKTASKSKTKK